MKKDVISNCFEQLFDTLALSQKCLKSEIDFFYKLVANTYRSGGKLIIFGNGGSASDAQHFAAELIGKYKKVRNPLPAISLNSDSSVLTCISNDFGYEHVFSRQIRALANKSDLLIGISTSGTSVNVINGLNEALNIKCKSILMTGPKERVQDNKYSLNIFVPSESTARIQEIHGLIIHILCELIDKDKSLQDI